MKIPIFQVDAFATRVFTGNPAAVCPLDAWLPVQTLQAIAAENNLSETAFFVGRGGTYAIRWFTPGSEVDLCGHATLASAFVVFRHLEPTLDVVRFSSESGTLAVTREDDLLVLDFPSRPPTRLDALPGLAEALRSEPVELWKARDVMAVLGTEDDVRSLRPDIAALDALGQFAFIVTAAGREADFVSRFFAPDVGIAEDPVTGSAHCTLVPYWSRRLGKTRLRALQVSARGGELLCEDRGDRVRIGGRAVGYLEGTIEV
jgi:predicted PhzF superfamily epimerase YddE/YHI9